MIWLYIGMGVLYAITLTAIFIYAARRDEEDE